MSKTLVVKYKKNGLNLEVLTKQGMMKPYRDGKAKMENVLASEQIFSNASKLDKAKATDIKKCADLIGAKKTHDSSVETPKGKKQQHKQKKSESSDPNQDVLKLILDEGEFQLNAKELKEMHDQRRGEILNYLHKYYHDPRGEKVTPHPVDRLSTLLSESKIRIDPHLTVERQIKPIVREMQERLPLRPMNPPHEMNLR